jgi:hypothetical protein
MKQERRDEELGLQAIERPILVNGNMMSRVTKYEPIHIFCIYWGLERL